MKNPIISYFAIKVLPAYQVVLEKEVVKRMSLFVYFTAVVAVHFASYSPRLSFRKGGRKETKGELTSCGLSVTWLIVVG